MLLRRTSTAFVKKKAALTLLRLYRKHPDIVQQEWAERMISLMDDSDMGVTLSITSLIMALAQDRPDEYKGSYIKAAQRLKRIVVDGDIAPDYLYYKVPCPWIQVKFLKLLQYFPPSGQSSRNDSHVRIMRFVSDCCRGQIYSRPDKAIVGSNSEGCFSYAKKCAAE